MKVIVTGATAPIGAAIVDHLLADREVEHVLGVGLEPVAADRTDDSRYHYRSIDLCRPRALHDLVWGAARQLGIDTVVHAALHRSPRAIGRHARALHIEGTRQLVLACEHHPTIRRVVFRSAGEVYALTADEPNLLDENAPLEFDPAVPQWVRDRVAADLLVCARTNMSGLSIAVLRCAEVFAPDAGSQLWDYVQSRVCMRPLGFDPMVNVLSLADQAHALALAAASRASGVFNIPGADTLPLSSVIARAGRIDLPVPGPLLAPAYRLRRWVLGLEFRYDMNLRRFHFGGVLDGTRAREVLGYRATHARWPVAA
jgi:UDP-glucose 4-epimerase